MTQKNAATLVFALTAMCCLVFLRTVGAADEELLQAVRNDDTRAVRALLAAGTDPNARDDIGTTALMHAAAFASPECMRALLDGKADVDASSRGGATARCRVALHEKTGGLLCRILHASYCRCSPPAS